MKVPTILLVVLGFALLPCESPAQNLDIYPRTLRLEEAAAQMKGMAHVEQYLQIRFETGSLRGSTWRLWLETIAPPQSLGRPLPAQVLSWRARRPFISGTLLPNERVLVGEGPIDGRPVSGRLIWSVRGELPVPGNYVGRLQLVLEEWP